MCGFWHALLAQV